MRLAIVDIGTNTINLAVAAVNDKGTNYQVIYSTKEPAKLGKGGINDGMITEEAMERGMKAIKKYAGLIKDFGVDETVAIGTSMLRNARNGAEFVKMVKEEFGFDIQVIDGDAEAQLIYDGVKQVMPIGPERVLILDIGGGSCEFIIVNNKGISWKKSFEVGMARLLDKFTPGDPIDPKTVKQIETYLRGELYELYEALKNYPVSTLIGTSGSFDTVAALIAARKHPDFNAKLATSYEVEMPNFFELHNKILASTSEERAAWPKMDKSRIDLIVLGSIFINFVIREMRIQRMIQCNYALKQGAIYQMVQKYYK